MTSVEEVQAQAPVVIIGSGLAGYTVARELRKLDSTVPIVMLTQDDGCFYSKPMLSNALAMKKEARALASFDALAMASQLRADIRVHQKVERIVPDEHSVIVNGSPLHYSKLVLATGADVRRLRVEGDAEAEILSINDLNDYARFRDALAGRKSVAILGAGLIGCEFANDLIAAGYAVMLIDPATTPLARLLPPTAGEVFANGLSESGVSLYLGRSVSSIERTPSGYRMVLSGGEQVHADLVVSAVGLVPRTALAAAAGLTIEHGVWTDANCLTSAEDVYALGDCAAILGKVQPYVLPIMHAARALARTLSGNPTRVEFPVMPVTVKTPATPAVVVSPDTEGQWRVDAATHAQPRAARAVFHHAENGQPVGFALVGAAVGDKAELLKEMALSGGR